MVFLHSHFWNLFSKMRLRLIILLFYVFPIFSYSSRIYVNIQLGLKSFVCPVKELHVQLVFFVYTCPACKTLSSVIRIYHYIFVLMRHSRSLIYILVAMYRSTTWCILLLCKFNLPEMRSGGSTNSEVCNLLKSEIFIQKDTLSFKEVNKLSKIQKAL